MYLQQVSMKDLYIAWERITHWEGELPQGEIDSGENFFRMPLVTCCD